MKKEVSCRDKSLPKEKMMVWLSAFALTPLLLLDEDTVDHSCYIKNVLAVAFKYENEVLVTNGSFDKMAKIHTEII